MTSAIAEKLPVARIGSHVSPNYKLQQAAAAMLLSWMDPFGDARLFSVPFHDLPYPPR
jgi:hypothetical protein